MESKPKKQDSCGLHAGHEAELIAAA